MNASVQAKNGRLYIVLGYKADGKWRRKWISTGLSERGNIRRAERMISEIMEKYAWLDVRSDIYPEITVPEFVNYWLAEVKGQVRPSTYEGYEYRSRKIRSYFKGEEIRQLTPQRCQKFADYLLQYGKTDQQTKEKEPLAARTVREIVNILKMACERAVFHKLLSSNPCDNIRVSGKSNREYEQEVVFFTQEELTNFLHYLKDDDDTYKKLVPMAYLCAYYGLRRSELLGLHWEDIDFERHVIHIRRTVTRVAEIHAEEETKTKASRRDLTMIPTTEKLLRQIQAEQEKNRKWHGNSYHDTGAVFTWEDGREYDPNYITRTFKHAFTDYGMPEMTLHKLRHSCASILLDAGWDLKKVQHWLGHEDAQTTLRIYAHYVKHLDNQDAADLAAATAGVDDLF